MPTGDDRVADAFAADLLAQVPAAAYTPELRVLRRGWSRTLAAEPAAVVLRAAETIAGWLPQPRKWLAYELIRFHPGAFAAADAALVERLVADVATWEATDAFGMTLTGPLWARGRLSDASIATWAASPDRWLRRSALVATVGLNARAHGPGGDAVRTLAVCRSLAADRDDMVVKALSWALRFLSQRDPAAVTAFIADQGDALAPRIRREVAHKLRNGVKTPRRAEVRG